MINFNYYLCELTSYYCQRLVAGEGQERIKNVN